MLKRPDDAPRDRHFRFRQRRKRGAAVYAVELGGEELEFLIRTSWLLEREVGDRHAVGRAIGALLAASARR